MVEFFGRRLPPSFRRRVVVIEPGGRLAHAGTEWRGELVVVESGRIELEDLDGNLVGFGPGDVLCLDGLPLRAVHCRGAEPAVLIAISRRLSPPSS